MRPFRKLKLYVDRKGNCIRASEKATTSWSAANANNSMDVINIFRCYRTRRRNPRRCVQLISHGFCRMHVIPRTDPDEDKRGCYSLPRLGFLNSTHRHFVAHWQCFLLPLYTPLWVTLVSSWPSSLTSRASVAGRDWQCFVSGPVNSGVDRTLCEVVLRSFIMYSSCVPATSKRPLGRVAH